MLVQRCLRLLQAAADVGLAVVYRLIVAALLLLPQLVQLGKYLLRLLLGLPHDAPRLGLAFGTGVVLGLLHLLPERPGLAGVLLPLLPQAIRLGLGLFQPLALLLQLGQHVLEPDGFAVHLGLGRLDDALVQSQPPGDGKGVGLAGDADEQPVSGPQGLHVELTAGVLHPRRGHGEGLQLRVVGGGRRQRPLASHVLYDGDGQRRALHRVCTRTQLVEQDEAPVVGLL